MHSSAYTTLNRRHFIKGASALFAVPNLEAFGAPIPPAGGPRNFVAVGTYLGWHQNAFYPKQAQKNYEMPTTLTPLSGHREEFTVFSGLDHGAPNGHEAWSNFMCGSSLRTYSLDQMIADRIGNETRFPSIQTTAGSGEMSTSKNMSYTRQGVALPMISRPSVLYKKLFVSAEDRERTEYILRSGRSSLDAVVEDAKRLQKALPHADRNKLDEYFDSVRAVEKRMGQQLETIHDIVTVPDYKLPSYDPITPNLQIEAEGIMYDLMTLALDSGSTRVLSMFLDGLGQVFSIDGRALGSGYHGLSHHGNDPSMIRDLVSIETAHIRCLADFLTQLREKKNAQGKSLLDDTVVLVGTGMGDASRHSNLNLPTLVAGGGFDHKGYVAIDRGKKDAPLLGDLYITLQQKLGLATDSFSNATRNMNQIIS